MCICTLGDTYTMSNTENGGLHISRTLIDPLVWDYAKDLYRQHIMNPTILIRQLQKELAIINKKVNTIRNEISSIVERVDKVEERMIFFTSPKVEVKN